MPEKLVDYLNRGTCCINTMLELFLYLGENDLEACEYLMKNMMHKASPQNLWAFLHGYTMEGKRSPFWDAEKDVILGYDKEKMQRLLSLFEEQFHMIEEGKVSSTPFEKIQGTSFVPMDDMPPSKPASRKRKDVEREDKVERKRSKK